jgi:hypothetical protein
MKRITSSWAFALLLATTVRMPLHVSSNNTNTAQVVADPEIKINDNMGPGVQGRKVEELTYGNVDAVGRALERRGGLDIPGANTQQDGQGIGASAIINELGGQHGDDSAANALGLGQGQPGAADIGSLLSSQQQQNGAGVDANAILNGLAQGQGQGKGGQLEGGGSSAAEIANQLLGEQGKGNQGSGIDQVLNGLNGGGKGSKGQGGVEIIQVKETIIQQINRGGNKTSSAAELKTTSTSAEGLNTTVRFLCT